MAFSPSATASIAFFLLLQFLSRSYYVSAV
jgi:hypothetical protein